MSDHIEALERLARMRTDGTLTHAEFETEKARLLARPRSTEHVPTADSATDALGSDEPTRRGVSRWAWIIALAIGGSTLFLAWDRFGFGGHSVLVGGQGLVDQAVGAPSQWTRNEEADPMTDVQIISANRQIQADGFLIDTIIACRPSSGAVTYTFTTFGSDQTTPAEFQMRFGGSNQPVALHDAEFRKDGAKALVLQYGAPRYTNMFEIKDGGYWKLGSAKQLTIKLALKQGEPVFGIDQTDAVVTNVLGKCAQATPAIEEQRQTEAARPREPQTHTLTITDSFTINDGRNGGLSGLSRAGIGVETVSGLCVGDKLAVKNDAAEPVRLIAGIYESDSITDIGSLSPGATDTLDTPEKGEFIITSPEHETVRMRYRVTDCTK